MSAPVPARRACVIGWPVAHSRSPLIHGYWLEHYGIEGSYGREAVAPEDLASFIERLGSLGYVGCNVTLPHKEAVYGLVEVQDDTTRRIEAVNTLYLEGGRLLGFNSDAYGFVAHLRSVLPEWRGEGTDVVVLGAGGAARAIVAGLLGEGVAASPSPTGRKPAGGLWPRTSARKWTRFPGRRSPTGSTQCDLLVNTTQLGMAGQPALPIDLDGLPRRGGRRYRLRAAGNRTAAPGQGAWPSGDRWPRHAAAPGGSGIRSLVRGQADVTPRLRALIESDLAG
jgi:shikimate dehydrogenase